MSREDRLIFLLLTAQQALRNQTNRALAAEGVRITVAQSGILFLLKHQDRRMISEVGRILGIENSAMTGLVDRLEKSGFVRRAANPADRRALLICITPAGLEEIEKAKPIIRRVNNEIRAGCTDHEIDGFKSVLNWILNRSKSI